MCENLFGPIKSQNILTQLLGLSVFDPTMDLNNLFKCVLLNIVL